MTPAAQRVTLGLGLLLGLGIVALCRFLPIPSRAPPVLPGVLLVVSTTQGHFVADQKLHPTDKPSTRSVAVAPTAGEADRERQAASRLRSFPV